uniref:Putative secreted protein n=1 Tax=Anopheles marajoara TaxID=58244 RepID=A0A2M4CBH8_9DIPT
MQLFVRLIILTFSRCSQSNFITSLSSLGTQTKKKFHRQPQQAAERKKRKCKHSKPSPCTLHQPFLGFAFPKHNPNQTTILCR